MTEAQYKYLRDKFNSEKSKITSSGHEFRHVELSIDHLVNLLDKLYEDDLYKGRPIGEAEHGVIQYHLGSYIFFGYRSGKTLVAEIVNSCKRYVKELYESSTVQ